MYAEVFQPDPMTETEMAEEEFDVTCDAYDVLETSDFQDVMLQLEAAVGSSDEPTEQWRGRLGAALIKLTGLVEEHRDPEGGLHACAELPCLSGRAMDILCELDRRQREILLRVSGLHALLASAGCSARISGLVTKTRHLVRAICCYVDRLCALGRELERCEIRMARRSVMMGTSPGEPPVHHWVN
mgnify:CR=1 FL=1